MIMATSAMGAAAIAANAYLIFLRAQAVFAHNKPAVFAFGLLWLATAACSFASPAAPTGIHIGDTNRCITGKVRAYDSAGVVAAAITDTTIFLAITYRLLTVHVIGQGWSSRMRSFFSGAGMHEVSRALLQTGQLYYLYAPFLPPLILV